MKTMITEWSESKGRIEEEIGKKLEVGTLGS